MSGLAFSPTDGTLFASLEITGLTETDLYTINPSTGVATKRGVINTGCCVADIAFSVSGTLFGWNLANATGLETINTTTGLGTVVNAVIGTTPLGITALTFDPTGHLLGALTPAGAGTSSLYSIDTTTGTPTLIGGPIGAFGTSGLAFTQVPEPTSALLLGSALLAVGIVLSRRTRLN